MRDRLNNVVNWLKKDSRWTNADDVLLFVIVVNLTLLNWGA